MDTLSFVQNSEVQSSNGSIRSSVNVGSFIPPMPIISGLILLVGTLVVASLYYFPLTAMSAVILLALLANKYAKRSHLTLFHDGYSPDVYVEDIEGLRE